MIAFNSWACMACVIGASIAWSASAGDPAPSAAAMKRYQQERAACLSGQTHQQQETCLREAGAALQQARRGNVEDAPSDTAQNRLRRCDLHPQPQDREECIRRMDQGRTTGSVEGGGIIRELVTRPVAQ